MLERRGGNRSTLMHYILVAAIICILITTSSIGSMQLNRSYIISPSRDVFSYVRPQVLKQLEWEFPPGFEPGTFQDYIKHRPYSKAYFIAPYACEKRSKNSKVDVSVLVENSLYNSVEDNLLQYVQDLESMGYVVSVELLAGGNPEEVKSWVRDQYNEGASGVVFIGDIPAAWVRVGDETFPCDLYYMDLDGLWVDSDEDGVYDVHESGNGDTGPELYVGRLFVSTLSWGSEAGLVNDYLDKVHRYRTGELVVPWRGLEYIDEDWYDMDAHLNDIYGKNVSRYDLGYHTTAQDYLKKLSLGQHFVQVCAHSFSGGHHFGTRPTEAVAYANVYVYGPSEREGFLFVGSDDGVKVWWNGENVITADVYDKGWSADEYKTLVHLKQGWNRLLCKVSQKGGKYLLSARLTDLSYQPFDDLTYQTSNPLVTGPEAPYIRSWLVNGFHQDIPENFYQYLTTNYLGVNESNVVPEEGEEMGGCVWTRVDNGYPYVDLDDYFGGVDYGVSYAFATVYAERETNCQLWVGYDDGMRAWLNGEEILFDNRYGGFEPDMKKINVTLVEGENHLLLKVSEWMGEHGFTARFCDEHGNLVDGLSYAFPPKPVTYIGTWLVDGVYENKNQSNRLNVDYLGNESTVAPAEGDDTVVGVWNRGIGNGYPFDLGGFFDHGGWVFSSDIQDLDPPVLFYNLFSCGPGRFTDKGYLAGSYIFHTSYGLVTVASSKSGSMLNFEDFTKPVAEGMSIGEAFFTWFNKQAPFEEWEKEWYYGMVLCGDPTLHVFPAKVSAPSIRIVRPVDRLYLWDRELFPLRKPLVIGNLTVEVEVLNSGYGIRNVSFYVDGNCVYVDEEYPFEMVLGDYFVGNRNVRVVACDLGGQLAEDEVDVFVCNLGLFSRLSNIFY